MARYIPDDRYIPGGTNAICDRCGFQYRLFELSKEWTSLMVCSECWDPPPPQLRAPRVWPEGVPVPNARPEPPDVFVAPVISDGAGNAVSDGDGNYLVEFPGKLSPEPEDL